MEDQFLAVEGGEERLERKAGERIDEQIVARDADLDEAELFEIAVQAVRLGIDRDAGVRREQRENRRRGRSAVSIKRDSFSRATPSAAAPHSSSWT